MEYKVIPFRAYVSNAKEDVSLQVQNLISKKASEGWEFVSCGNIDTTIEGSNGCFGIGAKPATNTSVLVLVFKK